MRNLSLNFISRSRNGNFPVRLKTTTPRIRQGVGGMESQDNSSKQHIQQGPRSAGTVAAASALQMARLLSPPPTVATVGGETEGHDFWESHDTLLARAWEEYGRLHPEIYAMDEQFLHPSFLSLSRQARAGLITDASSLTRTLQEGCEAEEVYTLPIFTPEFEQKLLQEVEHLSSSGIPARRPNGMNRSGLILTNLGFEPLLAPLMREYVAPVAALLFPEWVSASGDECAEVYAFTVQYQQGQDLSLAEHYDTSILTLNLCLGKDFQGGDLVFGGFRHDRYNGRSPGSEEVPCNTRVTQKAHRGLLHLGGHKHGALPIESGFRLNLIVWGMCQHGVVLIRPRSWVPP